MNSFLQPFQLWLFPGQKYLWPFYGQKYLWPFYGQKYLWPFHGQKYFWLIHGQKYVNYSDLSNKPAVANNMYIGKMSKMKQTWEVLIRACRWDFLYLLLHVSVAALSEINKPGGYDKACRWKIFSERIKCARPLLDRSEYFQS